MWKNKDSVINAYETTSISPARKRMRHASNRDIEMALFEWFKTVRSQNVPIDGPMLARKANSLACELGMENFQATNGFIERFKNRHGISSKTLSGEGASVDNSQTENWMQSKLPSLIKDYEPKNVYNIDETGVFYKMTPNKTLEVKGTKCFGGKQSKDRITVLIGANMDGSDKLKLLIIGKFKNPRCFKNVKSLPVDYEANRRAWMNSEIFISWVKKLDKRMTREKRSILLFVDNCPAHPKIEGLKAVKLLFFPPNTTSKLQPCDQGIIFSFKRHYRSRVLDHIISCLDKHIDKQINILKAIQWFYAAWKDVTPTCIQNCFRKAGFMNQAQHEINATPQGHVSDSSDTDEFEDDDIPLAELASKWNRLRVFSDIDKNISFDDYINADENVVSVEQKSDSDIIAEVQQKLKPAETLSQSDEESVSETVDDPPPTMNEFLNAIDTCRRFVLSKSDSCDSVFGCLHELEKFSVEIGKAKKQTKLTDFFRQ
ncbi:tigger transposable element-derived protein 4-like [Ruditapes philippinarum]|uniref:tigger transposable element-derived protein 4-like n=1 Tax=Ruditapes philippinarum TaxID=129788 RepID=UPI00295AB74B|nr:tigger transposable element-derived protein 4-like [Ruditapes philippinarum]